MSETEPLRHIVGKAELKSAEITEIKRNRSDDYSQYYEAISIDLNTQYAQRVLEKRYEGMNFSLQRLHIAWGIARYNDYAKTHKAKLNAMLMNFEAILKKVFTTSTLPLARTPTKNASVSLLNPTPTNRFLKAICLGNS